MINSCVIDLTKSLNNVIRGIDGISRVELETAAKLLSLGGRAIWIDKQQKIYEIDHQQFRKILSVAESFREKFTPVRRLLPELAAEIFLVLKQRQLLSLLRKTFFYPRERECFLLFGAYWDRSSQEIPALLSRLVGAKIISFVHDLVPIRHPELTHSPREMAESFPRYLHTISSLSKTILTNSNFTANEFIEYCRLRGLKAPPPKVVTLASDLDLKASPIATPRLVAAKLKSKKFSLMVSTIEPRKNHRFALGLWRELRSRMPDSTIPLVFAGKRGWLYEDILENIQREENMPGSSIFLVESASDEELAWLYQNARFTLYPSSMEGWGLPICESLSFGTHCLAADNSAMKESSQGLAWHGSTENNDLWIEEIRRCNTETGYLERRCLAIVKIYKKRRWDEFTRDVISLL